MENKICKCGEKKWKHKWGALGLPFSYPCEEFKPKENEGDN